MFSSIFITLLPLLWHLASASEWTEYTNDDAFSLPPITDTTPFKPNPPPLHLLSPRDDDAASTTSMEYTNNDAFRNAVLNATNTYRRQHNATGLRWNETLAQKAGEWSAGCVWEHSGGPTGENLSSGYPNASASVVAWGDERAKYDFKKGAFAEDTGHFTQLVWKATTDVGCARTECAGKKGRARKGKDGPPGWFVVCEYWPAGNVLQHFTQNVQSQVNNDNKPADVPTGTAPPPTSSAPPAQPTKCPMGGVCSSGEKIVQRASVPLLSAFALGISLASNIL